jgi:hypothetical protein
LLYDKVFPLHVPKPAQTLPECFDAACVSGSRAAAEESYPGHFRWLLRLSHGPGPCEREDNNDKPQPH